MPVPEYLDCELHLTSCERAVLWVRYPEKSGRAEYPGKPQLEDVLTDLRALEADPKEYGIRLFRALFPTGDKLYEGYVASRRAAGDRPLRLRLHVDAEETRLHDLHWELLFDPEEGGVALARARGTAFSRYLSVGVPAPEPVRGKLRILVAAACPANLAKFHLPALDREEIYRSLRHALEPLGEDRVEYELLDGPVTTRQIQERLVARELHVLHLCAHGKIVGKEPQASLALEDDDHRVDWVGEERFAEIFEGGRDLRFVFLVACHGGRKSGDDPFSGLGPRLVRRVPAVLAMRREIGIEAAERLAGYFYGNLARGGPLDVAVNFARQQIYQHDPRRDDWGIPVLFMRLADGLLWEPPLPCPYVGLRSFEERHSAHFFGREREVRRLFEKVRRGPVVVSGPSGSGKSSVVKAGLLPRLRRLRPPEATWEAVVFTPGTDPSGQMATALRQRLRELGKDQEGEPARLAQEIVAASGAGRLLIVVDQLEEIVTQVRRDEGRRFARTLCQIPGKLPRVTLLLTLRPEFYGQVSALDPELGRLLEQRTFHLEAMSREELAEAIHGPAAAVGLAVEPGLAEKILDDLGDEPGGLPLLEFALTELWKRDPGRRRLTHESYEAIGTVRTAIAQRADEIFDSLTEEKQRALPHVLTRLVRPARPEEGAPDVRRRVRLSEIDATLIQELVDERLLVTRRDPESGEEAVELAHDALIRHWGKLDGWLRGPDRPFLLWRDRLRQDKDDWTSRGSDAGDLYRGLELEQAEEWVRSHGGQLNADELAFVKAAVGEQARRRRATRNRRLAAVVAATVLVVVGTWSTLLLRDNRRQQQIGLARELTQRAAEIGSRYPQRSLLLAVAAAKLARDAGHHPPEVEGALRAALSAIGGEPFGPRESVLDVFLGHEMGWLATRTGPGRLRLTPLTASAELAGPSFEPVDVGPRSDVEFSPDGGWMAVTGGGSAPAQLWRLSPAGPRLAFAIRSPENLLRLSRDGTGLAVTLQAMVEQEAIGELQWWTLGEHDSPAQTFSLAERPCESLVTSLDVSPDNRWLVTVHLNGRAHLWDRQEKNASCPTLPTTAAILDATFHPAGPWLALAADDGLILMRPAPGGAWETLRHPELGAVSGVAFSSERHLRTRQSGGFTIWDFDIDNGTVSGPREGVSRDATVSPGGTWILDPEDNRLRASRVLPPDGEIVLRGHDADDEGPVQLAVDPRDRWLVTWIGQERPRRWDLEAESPATGPEPRVLRAGGAMEVVTFLSGGDAPQLVAVGKAGLWSAETFHCPEQSGSLKDFAFSQDRGLLATLDDRGTACLWRLTPPRPVRAASFVPAGDPTAISRLAIANDGSWLAWTSGAGVYLARLGNDYQPRAPVLLAGHQHEVQGIAFDPRSRRLATAGAGEPPCLWDLTDPSAPPRQLERTRGQVQAVLFDPGGRFWFTGGTEDSGRLWDLEEKEEAKGTVEGRESPFGPKIGVRAAAFSPAGPSSGADASSRWLAIGDLQGWVHLWEPERKASTARPLPAGKSAVTTLAFSPDGAWLAAATEDGPCRLWRLTDEERLSDPLTLPVEGEVRGLAFSPDSRHLATTGSAGVLLWKLLDDCWEGLDDLVELACETAGRNLTRDEWHDVMGQRRAYPQVCPDLPIPPG